ncbi:helix-turn-helix domain-containing protein [Patescibacteria group bacterium]
MKTVGEILKETRKKQGKTVLQIHKITKIPEKTIIDLEKDDFSSLPPAAFVKGFIRSYANALNLNHQKLLGVFRRDWQESEKGEIVPKVLVSSLDKPKFSWNPKKTFALSLGFIIFLFLSYIGLQLSGFLSPPKLEVEKPSENQEVSEETIEVIGTVDIDASVYINENLIEINDDGKFIYNFKLFPGENTIEVKAVDRKGKETIVVKKVNLKQN